MKRRFLICTIVSISFLSMKAQENFSVYMHLKTEPTEKINFNESNIGFSFNKKTGSKNKISSTLEYSNLKVNYDSGNFGSFENLDRLHQIQNNFEVSHAISNTTKLNLSLIPTANFQGKLDGSDISLLGSFILKHQFNSNTTFNLGAARTTVFGNPKFMPVFSLHYKVNEQSDVLIGFPDSKISYANNIRNKFSLSNSFNGNFYHLDAQNNFNTTASKVVLSQMTTAFEYERNVDKNWFLNFKAGYDFDKKYNLIDSDNHKIYDFNPGNGYVLGIVIKYKQ